MGTQAVTVTPVSLNPKNFVSGGLLNDVDLEILEMKATLEKPEHYTYEDRIFVKMRAKNLGTGAEEENFWAAGSNADFSPSLDGNQILPNTDSGSSATALRKNSNFSAMVVSLWTNGGMPEAYLDGPKGLSALVGLRFHGMQAPAPERPGIDKKAEQPGKKKYDATVLICFKVLPPAPWETKKPVAGTARRVVTGAPAAAPVAPAPAAATSAQPPAPAAGDEDGKIIQVINGLIDDAPVDENGVQKIPAVATKEGVAAMVFNKLVKFGFKVPERTAAAKKVVDADWLAANGFLLEEGFVYKAG